MAGCSDTSSPVTKRMQASDPVEQFVPFTNFRPAVGLDAVRAKITRKSVTTAVDRNACTLASVLAHELMHVVGNPWTHDHSGQYIRCYRFTNSVESEVLHYLKQRYPSA